MVTRHVLPSGLTILIETLPYVRSVALGYTLRSGSAVESEQHSGASHFLDHLVHEMFVTAFWPDHPLGRPILGTEETVNRLVRKQILEHYAETFHPANMIFAASGNVRPEQIIPFLERAFPSDAGTPVQRPWNAPTPTQHMMLREKRELEQVHLCLGSRGFPQQDNARYAAALFNSVLGGGMSSRLFQRIREKEGLVYTVLSYHNGY